MTSQMIQANGARLYCEIEGDGPPVVFVHELSGSYRSYDEQVPAFKDGFRCIRYSARGYPPSEVPASRESYSQEIAAADLLAVLDGLGVPKAHVIGINMGSATVLEFTLKNPSRAASMTIANVGHGADMPPEAMSEMMEKIAVLVETQGLAAFLKTLYEGPNRRRLKETQPEIFRRWVEAMNQLSPVGLVNMMRANQARRPPIYAFESQFKACKVPTLVLLGGEEEHHLKKPTDFVVRTMPDARIVVMPDTGHALNLEKPALFNRIVREFIEGKRQPAGSSTTVSA